MELLTVPLDILIPDPRNPRGHPTENIKAIASSLKRFGQVLPLLVREADCQVVAGNGTLQAMLDMGWAECQVALYDGTDQECKALSVALNRTAELAIWDEEHLTQTVAELREAGFEDMPALGFSTEALDDFVSIFKGEAATVGDIDPYKEWQGMPAYQNEDKSGIKNLIVHFKNADDLAKFAEVTGCAITDKTKFIWYPAIEDEKYADKRYTSES